MYRGRTRTAKRREATRDDAGQHEESGTVPGYRAIAQAAPRSRGTSIRRRRAQVEHGGIMRELGSDGRTDASHSCAGRLIATVADLLC
jgi:hypothetical protein